MASTTHVVQEVITQNDITTQILTNAEVLFNRERGLKIVTAQGANGLVYYTSIVAEDPKSASVHKEYKVVLKGPGEKNRRLSMMNLLSDVEKRVSKQVFKQ